MTIGDQVRRIEPSDQVVLDFDGNVVGLKSGKSSGLEGRMLLPTTADAVQALVSLDGIWGNGGREQLFDGAAIPDPRKRAGMSGVFATQSTTSGYLDPAYSRRIVVTQDISATTSGVTAAGGQDLTLFPTAAAAGFRWDEPNRPFRSATSQANNSLAVITILEA